MREREVKDVSYVSRLSEALADSKYSNLGFYLERVLINDTHNLKNQLIMVICYLSFNCYS